MFPCCWGVFHDDEEGCRHVMPCDREGEVLEAHTAYDCWCKPQPDDSNPYVIIHNNRPRAGLH